MSIALRRLSLPSFMALALASSAFATSPPWTSPDDCVQRFAYPVVELIGGVPRDGTFADDAIQCRIDTAASGATVAIPAGNWVLARGLTITDHSVSLVGAGAEQGGTTLWASPSLQEAPMLRVSANDVTVSGIRFNANRDARYFLSDCCGLSSQPEVGATVIARYPDRFVFQNNRIEHTLFGSSLPIDGHSNSVIGNIIVDGGFGAGDPDPKPGEGMWADGISLERCDEGGVVSGNTIVDATDVPIALFRVDHCTISNNRILNVHRYSFTATGLPYKFHVAADHTVQPTNNAVGNIVVEGNVIVSAHGLQAVGLAMGGAAFECNPSEDHTSFPPTTTGSSTYVVGGQDTRAEFRNNRVWGTQIGLGLYDVENMRVEAGNTAERCVTQEAIDLFAGEPQDIRNDAQLALYTCSDGTVLTGDGPSGRSILRLRDRDYALAPSKAVDVADPQNWASSTGACQNANRPASHAQGSCGTAPFLFNGLSGGQTIQIAATADARSVVVHTAHPRNCGWILHTPPGQSWATLVASGLSNLTRPVDQAPTTGDIVIALSPNPGAERNTIFPLETSPSNTSIQITQCAGGVLSATTFNAPATGGSAQVTVSATHCPWTATAVDGTGAAIDWISVAPASGSGNGAFTLTVAPNQGGPIRTGYVTAAGQTLTVTQAASCPALITGPPASTPFSSAATNGQLSVTADVGCTWTARPRDSWIHLGGTGGTVTATGSRLLSFSLDQNTDGHGRAGTIDIGDLSFTFNQNAAPPPSACASITRFDGTIGTIYEPQSIILNVVADNASSYVWYDAANPGVPIGNSAQLLIGVTDGRYPHPGAGNTLTKSYYALVGAAGCSSVQTGTATVTVVGASGDTSNFRITGDPTPTVHSPARGTSVPISIQINNYDPNTDGNGTPGTYPVTFQWYVGVTPDQSQPTSPQQTDTATSSSIVVTPNSSTFYWCKVSIFARRQWLSLSSGTSRVLVPSPTRRRVVAHDYNGDGKADLLWRHQLTGEVHYWAMNGQQHISTLALPAQALTMQLQSIGDLNGDGRPDLIYRNPTTGENSFSVLNGVVQFTFPLPAEPDLHCYIGAAADMDGDGQDDLVWYNTATSEVRLWFLQTNTKVGSWSVGRAPSSDWRLQGAADMNGDGKPDLLFRNFRTGENSAWLMDDYRLSAIVQLAPTGTSTASALTANAALADPQDSAHWRTAEAGNVAGDTRSGIWWFQGTTGETQLWWMSNTSCDSAQAGDTEPDHQWQIVGVGSGAPDPTPAVAPVVSFSASCSGRTCAFDASASRDTAGISSYTWNFGDGSASGSQVHPTHTYPANGTYSVTLTVAGGEGLTAQATQSVLAVDSPPTASFYVGCTDRACNASSEASGDDQGIVLYTWGWGDGSSTIGGSGSSAPSHTYAAYGTYTVVLTVTDGAGQSATTSQAAYVSRGPVAAFTFTCAARTCDVDGSASSSDVVIADYRWDWGDESTTDATAPTAHHVFLYDGTFTVHLTATDASGRPAGVSRAITVFESPTASFTLTCANRLCQADASASRDEQGIASYGWAWGDGQTSIGGPATSHLYTTTGNYTITLTVTNPAGHASTTTRSRPVVSVQTLGFLALGKFRLLLSNDGSQGSIGGKIKNSTGPAPRPIAGDWNGDGTHTFGLYDDSTATFYLRNTNSDGNADLVFTFGVPGAGRLPVAGDWNGDGVDTIGLYDPTTRMFYLRNSNSAGAADLTVSTVGAGSSWLPLVGDWNGDGIDTVGLYDPATSTFYLTNSNSTPVIDLSFVFGTPGTDRMPVVGDWDGDGHDSIGLCQQVSQQCFLRNQNAAGPADYQVAIPNAGSSPVAGDWDGPLK